MAESLENWDDFSLGLSCAALEPGLRTVLVYDMPPASLRLAAQTLTEMLTALGEPFSPEDRGFPVEQVFLGTTESEDDLWGSLTLAPGGTAEDERLFVPSPGILTGFGIDSTVRLIVVPELSRLSPAAARACLVLAGADVANYQRHGRQRCWQPRNYWLAACQSSELRRVSPHLLDRFAVRLSGTGRQVDRVKALVAILDNQQEEDSHHSSFSAQLRESLCNALPVWPKMTPEATVRVIEFHSPPANTLARREITLARMARALARLKCAECVTKADVDHAAQLLHLRAPHSGSLKADESSVEPAKKQPSISRGDDPGHAVVPSEAIPTEAPEGKTEIPVVSPESRAMHTKVSGPIEAYFEDTVDVDRESASLRLTVLSRSEKSERRGAIVGIQRTNKPVDLAMINTLMEAAKYQRFRRQNRKGPKGRLLLSSADLRCYRRAPTNDSLLVVVLDYTCLQNVLWQDALLPYLRRAYAERASVCLVQVGAVDAANELQATRLTASSLLTPRILDAFETEPGRATPLAHGLELALQTLQRNCHRLQRAVLVMLTDGRGNVPLEASHAGKVTQSVGQEGVEEALQFARQLGRLKGLTSILLNPQPVQHGELPIALANAVLAEMMNVEVLTDDKA